MVEIDPLELALRGLPDENLLAAVAHGLASALRISMNCSHQTGSGSRWSSWTAPLSA